MEEESRASGSEEVVQLEDAVKLLVEHLVEPVLPRGQVDREKALSRETQEIVARQVHATVLLYNYYHRKQFPELEFASPDRFCKFASLISNKNLLMYINQAQNHLGNRVGEGLSVTEKAIVNACDIAEELDPTKDSPEMIMWPICKVAVLLLNQTKKVCLLQRDSETKGIWSLFEKDITTTSLGGSISSDISVQGPSSKPKPLPSQPYKLQTIAYSEVELKTDMKRRNLRFIEEHRVYSLSKKGEATMLFVLHYDQAVDSKFREMPLDALIERMSGPIFESGTYQITTSVVECYHLLPYKEVLLNILNRDRPLGRSSLNAPKQRVFQNGKTSTPSKIDGNLKERGASKSKMRKITTDISTQKKNKKVVKAIGDSGTKNCSSSSKNSKDSNTNSKRKLEVFETEFSTYAEHGDGQSPTKHLQASVQMDKNTIDKNSESRNVPQDITPTPDVDPVINDHALKSQMKKVTEKFGVQMGKNRTDKNSESRNVPHDIILLNNSTPLDDPGINDQASRSQMEKVTEMSGGITDVQMDKNRTDKNFESRNVPHDIIPVNNSAPVVNPVINDEALRSQMEKVIEMSGVEMDKNRTDKNSESRNVPHDVIPVNNSTPVVDPVINDNDLKSQMEKVIENSSGIIGNMKVQKFATMELVRRMLHDTRHENSVLGDLIAEYEMDLQTMSTETEMTPKLTSILKKYENSWKMTEVANPISSGEDCQTMNIKRKKLKEAILYLNRCQELDTICRESKWILPTYSVRPSVMGDMYRANVYLTGPDFDLSAQGDMKVTPHEARDSAASNMLSQLRQKARED